YTTTRNTTLNVGAPGVLGNDTDADGDALTAAVVLNPVHGNLSLSTNGGFTYTPTNNYTGPDSFTYRASDGQSTSGVATVSLTINNSNNVPVANSQSVSTPEDTPKAIVLTGTDLDGDPLTFIIVNGPTNGALSLINTNAGTLTYTPNTNFNG